MTERYDLIDAQVQAADDAAQRYQDRLSAHPACVDPEHPGCVHCGNEELYRTPEYQQFVESVMKYCDCCSLCDESPGGMCDQMRCRCDDWEDEEE